MPDHLVVATDDWAFIRSSTASEAGAADLGPVLGPGAKDGSRSREFKLALIAAAIRPARPIRR